MRLLVPVPNYQEEPGQILESEEHREPQLQVALCRERRQERETCRHTHKKKNTPPWASSK